MLNLYNSKGTMQMWTMDTNIQRGDYIVGGKVMDGDDHGMIIGGIDVVYKLNLTVSMRYHV